MKRFAFIERSKKALSVPIERLCEILGVTSRGYRSWKSRPISERQRRDMVLLAHIREHYALSGNSYGRPRMTMELKDMGFVVGERRVGRLMSENEIKAIRTRRYKRTTDSNHSLGYAPNLLDRDFTAERPDEKWSVDISYIWTAEGWLYLAIVMDLFSRKIIGWAASDRMKKGLAIEALDRAIALRKPPAGCVHHSDRGSQYCSHDYQNRLKENGFLISMSGTGNCFDNAVVETFFKTLKAELLWRRKWLSRQDVKNALFQWINGFYNQRRRHSTLGWKSPAAYELDAA